MDKLENLKEHQHKTNKLAKNTLKAISKIYGADYNETLNLFKDGHETVTTAFWLEFYKEDITRVEKYNRIYFCHGCKKFEMYFDAEDD